MRKAEIAGLALGMLIVAGILCMGAATNFDKRERPGCPTARVVKTLTLSYQSDQFGATEETINYNGLVRMIVYNVPALAGTDTKITYYLRDENGCNVYTKTLIPEGTTYVDVLGANVIPIAGTTTLRYYATAAQTSNVDVTATIYLNP